jgi:Tat protein translocase TatB subunit
VGNIGSGEILVVLMLGLLVLGPTRLAVVARRVGSMTREVRRVAGAFQEEVRDLVEDPSIEALARERGRRVAESTPEEPEPPTESDSV